MKRMLALALLLMSSSAWAGLNVVTYREYLDGKLAGGDYQRGFVVGYLEGLTEQMQAHRIPLEQTFNNGQGRPLGCNIPPEVVFNLEWAEAVLKREIQEPSSILERSGYRNIDTIPIWHVLYETVKRDYPCPR